MGRDRERGKYREREMGREIERGGRYRVREMGRDRERGDTE